MTKDLKDLARKISKIDFCMMTTVDGNGTMHTRPMSNNGEVEYDGSSYFFTYKDSAKFRQIENHSGTSLSYQTDDMFFVEVYGHSKTIEDKMQMEKYWLKELKKWFPQGLETPGIVMIKTEAHKIKFWDKENQGEINIKN